MKIDETNVIQELGKKNEKAMDYVIDKYVGLIYSIVRKSLYAFESGQEECVNDILMAIWQHSEAFDPQKNSFKNWIGAISQYKCIDYKRKYGPLLKEESLEGVEEFIGKEQAPNELEERLRRKELEEELEGLLSALSKEDQVLFRAYYIEDKSLEHLAEEKGVRLSALYNKLSRGRKKMKSLGEENNKRRGML